MTIQAISSASAIALASAILILFAVKTWHFVSSPFGQSRNFANTIMIEAAQRFREQVESLGRQQMLYLTISLMFIVTFGIAIILRPQETFGELPFWQTIAILIIVSLGACYGLFLLVRTIRQRRLMAFVRDANIAIGHNLLRLTANHNRIFHEVPVASGVIDNVVAGLHGIYSVNVVAVRPGKDNRVRLDGETLSFASGSDSISLAEFERFAKQLGKNLKSLTQQNVRVRPVIAVPGWEIQSQASEKFLLVNERSLSMIRAWKDENDYLLNEDVDVIHTYLTENGTRSARSNP